ncbi:exopolysaccharide biosynthesis polyprenyl glycosylphosphotransferase [Sphingomonas sp. HITSZ_GF]|uniref:exopolysaccharide biosynthesis polyprenyl glycosylphosphotransferase n=1 Tax=Sphingomonas sp. HITSZ_GF TaxID=3037247 RepID=UPI00240E4401|nr:exopolysaccharide biosynthesis polyprenyl glycosylphosphotransferase [Sphingomonas sp. HITSZ_GF]MDG2535803.1 exopolysaccharide biosynthesis polyprenyl glycosylphosphotransferase [Sphingomonas sp. HITSZ_GF]
MNLEFGTIRAAKGEARSTRSRWQPSRAKLRARLHATLILLDLACIFVGFFVAGLIYEPGSGIEQWFYAASAFGAVYLAVALNGHAYATEVIVAPGKGILRSIQAFAISAAVILLVAFYFKATQNYSRVTIGLGSGLTVALLVIARQRFLGSARKILGGNPYSVVLITDGTQHIAPEGFSLVIAADDALDPNDDSPDMFDRLAAVLGEADRVVVGCSAERRLNWMRVLKGLGIRSEIFAPELSSLAPLEMGRWNGEPTLVVADGPLSKFDSFIKRGFDILIAGAALLVLGPAMLVFALLIRLESAGPALFVQTRIGQGNRMFRMLKFRSMRADNCDGNGDTSTQRDDDRITRIGHFIRRTSIDELPQLLNVLIGHMSIVGPRPHALGSRAEDKLFWEIDERYWHRHAAKPGLTGLAQIRGYRGATIRERDLTDRLQADLEYLKDWSIWKDIKILMMTFGVVVHKNAY